MPTIVSTATVFPPHYYSQESITEDLLMLWEPHGVRPGRVEALHANTSVGGRHIAVPKEEYYDLRGWEQPNEIYARVAVELGEAAIREALDGSGLGVDDLRLFAYASTTGLAIPTIDARLMNRLPFRPSTKRLPLFGLGCVAGAIGVARVADYLRGHPTEAAVFLVEEFCSLTIQKHDISIANLIACGLFGDGAAAVLMVGDEHPLAGPPGGDGQAFAHNDAAYARPEVVATRSVFFPETEHFMGWEIKESGMQIVLSADVPDAARTLLSDEIRAFLGTHDLSVDDVDQWVCHPGGPKVVDAIEEGLGLDGDALARSRAVLRDVGNVSSVSVLLILDEVAREAPPPGSWGLMLAMGPAFCAELVLLRW